MCQFNSINDAGPFWKPLQLLVSRGCSFSASLPLSLQSIPALAPKSVSKRWCKPREWQTKACPTEDAAMTSTACFIAWFSLFYNTVPKPSWVTTSLRVTVPREMFSCSLSPRSFHKQMQPAASNCARGGKGFAVCVVLPPDLRSVFLSMCLCKLSKKHRAGNKILHF